MRFQHVKLGWMCWGFSHLIHRFCCGFSYLGMWSGNISHCIRWIFRVKFFGGFRNLVFRCADAKLARTIFQFPEKKLEPVATPGMRKKYISERDSTPGVHPIPEKKRPLLTLHGPPDFRFIDNPPSDTSVAAF